MYRIIHSLDVDCRFMRRLRRRVASSGPTGAVSESGRPRIRLNNDRKSFLRSHNLIGTLRRSVSRLANCPAVRPPAVSAMHCIDPVRHPLNRRIAMPTALDQFILRSVCGIRHCHTFDIMSTAVYSLLLAIAAELLKMNLQS